MTQRLESWDDLRYFLAVARLGTLAAASRALGVNQSTVFRRIGQLEENLGARLFDRQARGYDLTSVGEDMLNLAAQVEDDVLALDLAIHGADRELSGIVRITTLDEVLERLAPHLKCFRDQYPGIVLNVDTDQRLFSLSRREADVALRPGQRPTEPEIVGRSLVTLGAATYAAPSYLKGRTRPRRGAHLSKHCIIDFQETHRNVPTSQWLRTMVPESSIAYRASSMVGQKTAALAGLGIAVLPCFMGDPEPGLERLFAVREEPQSSLWLLYHADLRQTARVRALIDFVAEAITSESSLYEGTPR